MPDSPTPRGRDPKQDNVIRFRRRETRPATQRERKLAPTDLGAQLRGREGVLGLALIVVIAIALVAWRRLSGG